MFRVGDAIRVKAGTPPYADREDCSGIGCPSTSQFGRKLMYDNGLNILTEYLEPWNDNEEWDGTKWVAAGKPYRFIVGDSVRVKATATKWQTIPGTLEPNSSSFGKMLTINQTGHTTSHNKPAYRVVYWSGLDFIGNYSDMIGEEYLEPWIDAEEWDGEKWVAKGCPVPPKESSSKCEITTNPTEPFVPDEVIISGVRFVRKQEPSRKTNAEIAEELFKARMKHGRVLYSSDDMQAGVSVMKVSRTGNIVTVDFYAGE